ncbi:MAG: 30S ribosomal protein S2 [Sedimentisphaerales bacterium]|nr:30S ribosomal protein S2 [Sedimentisphaerales bacterium]
MAKELARDLISAGVHFGHSANRWNPKMGPYIFGKRGQIHIIDVRKTLAGLVIAKKLLSDVVSSGKDVVFVGTKRQAQKAVEESAVKCGMHYVSDRWLGGTLTNFRTIRSRVARLDELEVMQQAGTLESQSKKQASRLKRELRKIKGNMEGIRKMSRLPGAVVVVDGKKEYLALREAMKLGITTIGLIDTDCDPDCVDVVIPANDDSIRAVGLILNELAEAVAQGKSMAPGIKEAALKPRRVRSRRTVLARADKGGNAPAEEEGGSTEPAADELSEPKEQSTSDQTPQPEMKEEH